MPTLWCRFKRANFKTSLFDSLSDALHIQAVAFYGQYFIRNGGIYFPLIDARNVFNEICNRPDAVHTVDISLKL